jgi:hypothetical protein
MDEPQCNITGRQMVAEMSNVDQEGAYTGKRNNI